MVIIKESRRCAKEAPITAEGGSSAQQRSPMPLHYRAFQATFQLTPLKRRPVRDVWISFFFFAYEHPAASQSDQRTRKSLVLQPGCISEGPQPPIDQSAQTCPGPSPPMHHGAACWSQKSLTTTNISAATACLPLISCREIFLEYPSPFEEGEERKPHPSPPQSPGNYSQTHCSFLFFCSPPLAVLPVLAVSLLFLFLCTQPVLQYQHRPSSLYSRYTYWVYSTHNFDIPKCSTIGLIGNSRVIVITVGDAKTKQHNMTLWPQSFHQLKNL